jgi:hypothetical protein
LGLDALYCRNPEEEEYVRRLSAVRVPVNIRKIPLTAELLNLSLPVLPHRWTLPHTLCVASFKKFLEHGDLPNPKGGNIAMDSAGVARGIHRGRLW